MMEKIYSKVKEGLLLHQVLKLYEWERNEGRVNLVGDHEFLQCASLNLKKGSTFKPHKHNIVKNEFESERIAQESWVVIKGSVKVIFYDIDDKIIEERILYQGDVSFTFRGGHNYVILEDNTLVFEMKTGPYISQEVDKTFINEKK